MEKAFQLVMDGPFHLRLEDVHPDDYVLSEDQILVKAHYSLISPGTELSLYTGTHININNSNDKFAKYPFYPGYASVGEVVRIGGKVTRFRAGDLIFSASNHASYYKVSSSDDSAIKLPEGFSEQKALFARLAAISMTSVIQTNISIGDWAVIIGQGLIGNLAAQLYSIMGVNTIGIDTIHERISKARDTKIKEVIASSPDMDLLQEIEKITGGHRPDIVVEATGIAKLADTALQICRNRGQVVLLGSPRNMLEMNIYQDIHRRGIRLTGAHEILQGLDNLPKRGALLAYMLQLIDRGALHIDPLMTHELKAQNAGEAYDLLLNKKESTLGVILNWL